MAFLSIFWLRYSALYALIQVGLPIAATAWVVHRLNPSREAAPGGRERYRPALALLAVSYGLTATLGVPAIHNQQTAWAISEHDRLRGALNRDDASLVEGGLPNTATYAAFPLLPGVVLVYHDYTIAPTYGLEAWELYVWYGVGVKSAYRAIQNVTLGGIVETFDPVTLVEGYGCGKWTQTAAVGVGSQAVSECDPSGPCSNPG
jgi:hypothetical protein